MRTILIIFVLFSVQFFSQNKIVTSKKNGHKILVGICDKNDFANNNLFANWFNRGFNDYEPKFLNYDFDKEKIKNIKIKIVLGTWCPDSRREFPRFMKILDSLDFPEEHLTIICVNGKMKSLNGEEKGLNIKYVPTIIFYNSKNEELGRIIEHPTGENLEDDLEKILLSLPR